MNETQSGPPTKQRSGSKSCPCGCDDEPLYCKIAHELNKLFPDIDPFDDEKWIVDRIWKAITEHGIKATSNWNFVLDDAPKGEEILVCTKGGGVYVARQLDHGQSWCVANKTQHNTYIRHDEIVACAGINKPVKSGQITQEVQDYILKAFDEDRPLEGMG